MFAPSYRLKEAHKHPQFHGLNFIEAHVEGSYSFSEMVVVAQLGNIHPGLPAALGALAVGGEQGEVGLSSPSGGHQEPPGISQVGSHTQQLL